MPEQHAATAMRLAPREYKTEPAGHYGTPKEIWGFRTRAIRGSPVAAARAFLAANAALFELHPDLRGIRFRKRMSSLGAHHVVYQQMHDGRRVHRGYVSVHMDRSERVYLAKNRFMPVRLLPSSFEDRIGRARALTRAREALAHNERPSKLAGAPEQLWFPRERELVPAWKVRLVREGPREEWIVYVNALTHGILSKYDNLSESASGRGMVFYPSPVIALGGHRGLVSAGGVPLRPPLEAYRVVPLRDLERGSLCGPRVRVTSRSGRSVRRRDGEFMFESYEPGFEDVMVYYHVDAAIRYLGQLGYRGPRAIFEAPLTANARGTRDDNSWYSPTYKSLTFGTGGVDDAEDAETILHELGHAIQDAICPDFGQSEQAAAMGEGFGDYFAASYFDPVKPAAYRTSVMTWDGLEAGLDAGLHPPCLRRVDKRSTAKEFRSGGDEHANGQIWSATLWEVRLALGRDTAARVIVESHFQLDGFTTFVRGARAILDADRNLEGGRHVDTLKKIFAKRKIAPVA
ncbi:MAG TPA: M36 family metallopeptidase [Casimicrobiaceae bacterium]|nr:M36 family metallopeptidase [Casimicrobiaceae bacterium]